MRWTKMLGALMRRWSRGIYADHKTELAARNRVAGFPAVPAPGQERAGAGAAPCSTRPRPPSTGTAHAPAMAAKAGGPT